VFPDRRGPAVHDPRNQDSYRRRREAGSADERSIQRGWCLGSEEFRQELLAAAVERVGASHYGSDRLETGLHKAQRIVREEILIEIRYSPRRRFIDAARVMTFLIVFPAEGLDFPRPEP
jgi:hypothetical protein